MCEVKWALGSTATNKASRSDGIPAEHFKIPKDDVVKVLHSTCQQIWKTQQWPQDQNKSVFFPIPKKGAAIECSNYHTIALISHANKVMLKILQVRLFSSVTQSCLTLCNPMDCSTPGLPVHHQLPELTQTHVIKSVMPSNHLILCHPLLLLPSIFPSIRVLSNESVLLIKRPEYWSFSFNICPSNEHSGLISFRMDWFDLFAVQVTLESLLQHHSSKASILWHSAFFIVQLSHPYMTTGKTIALTRWTFVHKVISLLLLKKYFLFIFFVLFIYFSLFSSFIFISWRLITLQYCSGFCHTLTWISRGVTCIPHPDPPLPPPSPSDSS